MPFVPDTSQSSGRFVPDNPATGAPTDSDSTTGFVMGNLNKGIAGLAGLPVDTAKNVANLGIAGYGTIKGMMGGTDLPEPISAPVGGSEWIESKMRDKGAITASAEPESTGGRYAASALQNLPMSLVGGGTAAQLPAKALAAITSGAGGELGGDIGGSLGGVPGESAGRILGSLAPTSRARKGFKFTPEQESKAAGRKETAFNKAKELGQPVLPDEMQVDKQQVQREHVVNKLLGQPAGTEVTPKQLETYRKGFSDDYENLIKSKEFENGIRPNAKFAESINELGDEIASLRGKKPETFKSLKPVDELLRSDYGYGDKMDVIDPRTALRSIRKLRSDATTNLSSDKPEQREMGLAQRKIAMSLETLLEDAAEGNPQLMEKMRNARQKLAMSHDVEASLNPVTRKFDGARLSELWTKGSPLSGDLKKLAEVSGEFPQSTAASKNEDFFTHKTSPWAAEHPKVIAGNIISRNLNKMKESKPYQSVVVDPSKHLTPEQQRVIRLLAADQAANKKGAE